MISIMVHPTANTPLHPIRRLAVAVVNYMKIRGRLVKVGTYVTI